MCCNAGRLPMERSIGSVTAVETSCALAPGTGVMTTTYGNAMSGSSSCLSEAQAKMPPSSMAIVMSTVTLRLLTANWVKRITWGIPHFRGQAANVG